VLLLHSHLSHPSPSLRFSHLSTPLSSLPSHSHRVSSSNHHQGRPLTTTRVALSPPPGSPAHHHHGRPPTTATIVGEARFMVAGGGKVHGGLRTEVSWRLEEARLMAVGSEARLMRRRLQSFFFF
ncbi:unnamed protein product, partial [Brassica rapa subsp. trilocularis]